MRATRRDVDGKLQRTLPARRLQVLEDLPVDDQKIPRSANARTDRAR
jgi:hypothetical protein